MPERRSEIGRNEAVVHRLIQRVRVRKRESELLKMFNKAAAGVTVEDWEKRESLLAAAALAGELPESDYAIATQGGLPVA